MKFGIKLNNIEIGEVKIGGIEVNTELSINEMIAIRKESEHVLENLPVYIQNLANGYITAGQAERHIEQLEEEQTVKELTAKLKASAKLRAIAEMFAVG